MDDENAQKGDKKSTLINFLAKPKLTIAKLGVMPKAFLEKWRLLLVHLPVLFEYIVEFLAEIGLCKL